MPGGAGEGLGTRGINRCHTVPTAIDIHGHTLQLGDIVRYAADRHDPSPQESCVGILADGVRLFKIHRMFADEDDHRRVDGQPEIWLTLNPHELEVPLDSHSPGFKARAYAFVRSSVICEND